MIFDGKDPIVCYFHFNSVQRELILFQWDAKPEPSNLFPQLCCELTLKILVPLPYFSGVFLVWFIFFLVPLSLCPSGWMIFIIGQRPSVWNRWRIIWVSSKARFYISCYLMVYDPFSSQICKDTEHHVSPHRQSQSFYPLRLYICSLTWDNGAFSILASTHSTQMTFPLSSKLMDIQ